MARDQTRIHAQRGGFGLVRVSDIAGCQYLGCAGHVCEPVRDEPARARLRKRKPFSGGSHPLDDHLLQEFVLARDDVVSKSAGHDFVRLLDRGRRADAPQLYLAGPGAVPKFETLDGEQRLADHGLDV